MGAPMVIHGLAYEEENGELTCKLTRENPTFINVGFFSSKVVTEC
jgi:hypothetical protein